ncbi:hypothetical protein HBI56_008450 [Parastagonospora nodorum]|uniref:Concanavalin A-like lectin/glucanase n=1 Tax=Phaeosphaeria nodorum (strain SN15 / ATCC MYA-4574 / FGSC 10173) TaxID=321614 RepID=A0A7U2EQ33_PHANO|nr:hypothetical protein HBH56_235900 [Parastagonospora nodorum]QRC90968.1 hypothetical protein JI435_004790 [Parastagonospora nodorum SN15]KAH3934909.1 hypothetical protein HBH54_046820 [Parastagonospora nodorum]KAH3950163.1 hypothetical protein HBH53_077160 [Parastagonospora nodorum]KAH3987023.1 hypothetical protein HBH51_010230 [Parastagonospora nodorum]
MKFSVAFLTAALATSAVAAPWTLADRIKARAEGRQLHHSNPSKAFGASEERTFSAQSDETNNTVYGPHYSPTWGGAVLRTPSRSTFKTATGRFTVPVPRHVPGAGKESAAAWVGIDGDTCEGAILQTGVDFTIDENGNVNYESWYQFFPADSGDYINFKIRAGDVMQVDVNVLSSTTGTVKLSNLSTGQSMGKTLTAARGSELCQQNAEWIVEDFTYDGVQVPMSDFGMVVFTNAAATHSDGSKEGLERATVFNLRKDGDYYTEATIDSASQATVNFTYRY